MKPHEETWSLQQWFGHDVAAVGTPGAMLVPLTESVLAAPNSEPEEIERARLAASAPEMARMLIDAEWEAGRDYAVCIVCGGEKNHGGHLAGCRFVALMTKAGVR